VSRCRITICRLQQGDGDLSPSFLTPRLLPRLFQNRIRNASSTIRSMTRFSNSMPPNRAKRLRTAVATWEAMADRGVSSGTVAVVTISSWRAGPRGGKVLCGSTHEVRCRPFRPLQRNANASEVFIGSHSIDRANDKATEMISAIRETWSRKSSWVRGSGLGAGTGRSSSNSTAEGILTRPANPIQSER
jgi:hypothetical protein